MAMSVCPLGCPSTIACERDNLRTASPIDFKLEYGLYPTKTSDAIENQRIVITTLATRGHFVKNFTLCKILLVNAITWEPLARLTSNLNMIFIPSRPRTLSKISELWLQLKPPGGVLWKILFLDDNSWTLQWISFKCCTYWKHASVVKPIKNQRILVTILATRGHFLPSDVVSGW